MPVTDKIKNNLFIWGNNTTTGSDLATLAYTTENPFIGTSSDVPAGGELVEAGIINSGIRLGSLAAYSIIEALKKGPAALNAIPASATQYNDDWYTGLNDNLQFNYNDVNSNIDTFAANLNTVVNQYLKYSSVYAAVRANVWNTPRTFTIKDNSEEHSQANSGIDGSADVTLKLPSTIKADILGSATTVTDNVGDFSLSEIFVYDEDGQTSQVIDALNADRVYTTTRNDNTEDYILFTENATVGANADVRKNSDLRYNSYTNTLSTKKFQAPNFNGNYTTCSESGDTKTATLANFKLESGARIFVKFSSTHSGGNTPTLNVNNTGAKTLKWGNSSYSLTSFRKPNAGDIFELLYDGTYWVILVPNHISGAEYTKETLTITKNGYGFEFDGSSPTNLSFYAPNSSGTSGQVLLSNGSGYAPTWEYKYNISAGRLANFSGDYNVGNNKQPVYFSSGIPYKCLYSYRCGSGLSLTGSNSNNIGEAGSISSSSWNTWNNWFHGVYIKIGPVLKVSLRTDTTLNEDRWLRINLNWIVYQALSDNSYKVYLTDSSCQVTALRTSATGTPNCYCANMSNSTINNESVPCCFVSRDQAGGGTSAGFCLELTLLLNKD